MLNYFKYRRDSAVLDEVLGDMLEHQSQITQSFDQYAEQLNTEHLAPDARQSILFAMTECIAKLNLLHILIQEIKKGADRL